MTSLPKELRQKSKKNRWKYFSQKHFFIKRLGMKYWQRYPDFLAEKFENFSRNLNNFSKQKMKKTFSSNKSSEHLEGYFASMWKKYRKKSNKFSIRWRHKIRELVLYEKQMFSQKKYPQHCESSFDSHFPFQQRSKKFPGNW